MKSHGGPVMNNQPTLNLRSDSPQAGLFGADDDGTGYFETRQPVQPSDRPFNTYEPDRPTKAAPVKMIICLGPEPTGDEQPDLFSSGTDTQAQERQVTQARPDPLFIGARNWIPTVEMLSKLTVDRRAIEGPRCVELSPHYTHLKTAREGVQRFGYLPDEETARAFFKVPADLKLADHWNPKAAYHWNNGVSGQQMKTVTIWIVD